MRLRTQIFLTVFGLALLPLLILVGFNLPGHLAKHEDDARGANLARAEIRHAQLTGELARQRGSLRQVATLPLALDSLGGDEESAGRLASLLATWFEGEGAVEQVLLLGREGQPVFRAGRGQGREWRRQPAAAPPPSWPGRSEEGGLIQSESAPGREPQSFLYLTVPVTDGEGKTAGYALLALNLSSLLADYAGADWISPHGRYLHRAVAARGGMSGAATGEENVFAEAPGLQAVLRHSDNQPFIWDREEEHPQAWLPLLAAPGEEPLLWLVQPVSRAAEGWKKSLVLSIAWIILLMLLIVFFIANRMAADVERIKEDMLTGLDRILNEERGVRFRWRGPEELQALARELNALADRYGVTSEARQEAEAGLRESEEKFRNLTASARDAIILMDHQGNISYWNEAATTIFGYSDQEALGQPIHVLINPRRADTGGDIDRLDQTALLPETLELLTSRKDSTEVSVELSLSAGRIHDLWHAIWIVRDISERKRAAAEARRQQQQLIQADKMISLGLLVSGVAHEINNPNSIAMLNAPMLHRAWESVRPILDEYHRDHGEFLVAGLEFSEMREQVPRLFSEMEESTKRIKQIVQDLKDYARQDTSRLMEPVDLNEIAKAAVRLTYNKLKKSTRYFVTHYEPNLPPVKGNWHRLEQVIINLIHNACEALPDTQAGVTLATVHHPDQNRVEVRVQDEGVGIPHEVLGQITDPFFTTKRNLGGTGLGLSVSAGIVKEHQGTLHFDSEPGRGTMAIASFPVAGPQQQDQ